MGFLLLVIFLHTLQNHVSEACTALAAGRAATADGSVLLSHANDADAYTDPRLCFVPAADHSAGSQRPVFFDKSDYPRLIGTARGPCYQSGDGKVPHEPIGYIPEVLHTFAYYESTYGTLNEHGVGMAESTCAGVFQANASGHGGRALMSINELSRIGLERSKTAREAVKLMGQLAEQYGFYGMSPLLTAESLFVGDPEELFVFHVLPDPEGTSAIWAAQRVPDDHVAIVANIFTIRRIDFEDSHNFLFSNSVQEVAKLGGMWQPGQPLDFAALYSDGEILHKHYSGRRMWEAYRRFGITDLPMTYDAASTVPYPFSVKPANSVTGKPGVEPRDLFSLHRDFYEGTKFDLTRGLAAGPFGDPDRLIQEQTKVEGHWERSIGLYHTSDTFVVQARRKAAGSILWFAPHAAATSCFVPLSSLGSAVPQPYRLGNPHQLDRKTAYWAHRYVANIAKMRYSAVIHDVRALQARLEDEGSKLLQSLDTATSITAISINAAIASHADKVVQAFWELPDALMQKYSDGWNPDGKPAGYPDWWLKRIGYQVLV